jgi:hypothetical protein
MKKKKSRSGKTARTVRPSLSALPYRIPPILLEGDETSAPAPGLWPEREPGPGPAAAAGQIEAQGAGLPESYGTRTLLLSAREPHWLYAHWDIAPQEQRQYSALAVGQRLVLRVYEGEISGRPAAEAELHPGARHWPVHVPHAGTRYVADLGCYLPGGLWKSLAISEVVATPPEAVSADQRVRFATSERTFAAAASPASRPGRLSWPTGHPAAAQSEAPLWPALLPPAAWEGAAFEQAMAEAGLLGDGTVEDVPSAGGQSSLAAAAGAGQEPPKEFWLNVDAEIVLYGATEPDAMVTIAGEPIRLRPDGSFSCRFALPDGHFDVLVDAVSPGNDQRQVRLRFSRLTG